METTMANHEISGGRGQGNPGNFAHDRSRAAEAGRKGGQHQGKGTNPGNFANDRSRAADAGRKGGQRSRGGGAPRPDTDSSPSAH
jgi:general stress protein YciG